MRHAVAQWAISMPLALASLTASLSACTFRSTMHLPLHNARAGGPLQRTALGRAGLRHLLLSTDARRGGYLLLCSGKSCVSLLELGGCLLGLLCRGVGGSNTTQPGVNCRPLRARARTWTQGTCAHCSCTARS
jgi:hypothetical protein